MLSYQQEPGHSSINTFFSFQCESRERLEEDFGFDFPCVKFGVEFQMKAGDLPLLLTGVDQSELDGEVLTDHHPILLYHLNLYILDQEQKKTRRSTACKEIQENG